MSRLGTTMFGDPISPAGPGTTMFGDPIGEPTDSEKPAEPTLSVDDAVTGLAKAAVQPPAPGKGGRPAKAERFVRWGDKMVPAQAVVEYARSRNVSPETVMRLGTWQGRTEARLARTAPGRLLMAAEQGLGDIAVTGLSLASRAGLAPARMSANLHREQRLREEFLSMVEAGGDLESLLTPRGARMVNNATRSVAKVAATAPAGPLAIYGNIGAEAFDSGLAQAEQEGLLGTEAFKFAGWQSGMEVGVTLLMGQVARGMGLETVEEMLSPGMRAAAGRLTKDLGLKELFKQGAKRAGATAAGGSVEAWEESTVAALQQVGEVFAGIRDKFDAEPILEAGGTGLIATGGVGAARSINTKLKQQQPKIRETVKGVLAAEEAIGLVEDTPQHAPEAQEELAQEQAPTAEQQESEQSQETPAEVSRTARRFFQQATPEMLEKARTQLNRKEFEALTGLKNTSSTFRDSFRQTLRSYETAATVESEASPAGESTPSEPPRTIDPAQTVAEQPFENTSARNAMMARDRGLLDLSDLPPADHESFQQSLDTAVTNNVAARALDIARDVKLNPRTLTPVETAGMVVRAAELKMAFEAATDAIAAATDTGEQRIRAAEANRIQDEFDQVSTALRLAGTQTGRALAARKLTIDQDFSLVNVTRRAAAVNGKPLTLDERKTFEKMTRRLARLQKRLDAIEGRAGKDAQNRTADQLKKLQKRRNRAIFERDRQRIAIRDAITDMRPRKIWAKARDAFTDMPRAIITSLDFSAVLRQGGFLAFSRPVLAAKNIPSMMQAAFSREANARINREIGERPNAKLYEQAGLFIAKDDTGAKLSEREEQYMSRIVGDWGFIGASNRAYTTFLNRLRADTFDAMAATLTKGGQPTVEEAKALAHFVNVATGRGEFGHQGRDAALTHLSSIFFSPRYTLSRFQLMAGQPMYRAPGRVRSMIAKEYGRSLVGVGLMYGLAQMAFGDDEDFSITFDPRSSDAFKLKFGDLRLDPLFGMAQTIRFTTQMAMGEKVVTDAAGRTEVVPLRGPEANMQDTFDTLARFTRTKLAPLPGGAIDLLAGENVIGERVAVMQAAQNMFWPLSVREMWEAIEDQGLPAGTAFGLLAVFGVGLSVHDSPQDRRLADIEGRRRDQKAPRIANIPLY